MENRASSLPDPRRWIVLAAYMGVTLACEIQWLAHASVARAAEAFYAGQFDPGSIFNIDFLALSYMAVYLVLCIPASRLIDHGLALEALELHHPDPARIARLLASLNFDGPVTVVAAHAPRLVARIATPHGIKTLG